MRILIIIISVFVFQSCALTFTCRLDKENPTSYVFHKDTAFIKENLKKKLDTYEFKGMFLSYNGKRYYDETLCIEPILQLDANKYDFYLHKYEPIGRTKKYRSLFCYSTYEVSFLIHFEYIDNNKTFIKIKTINPQIMTGFKFKLGDNYSFLEPRFKKIEPTTIEEYELLFYIGKCIGEKNMPDLILP